MTNDELEAGPELDALVAEKVMHWIVHPRNTIHWMLRNDDEMDYLVKGEVGKWRPSTNIAAAWEVLKKIKSMSRDIQLDFAMNLNVTGPEDYSYLDFIDDLDALTPENICRAALKAVNQ